MQQSSTKVNIYTSCAVVFQWLQFSQRKAAQYKLGLHLNQPPETYTNN